MAIIQSSETVLLIGGAGLDRADLGRVRGLSNRIVAADGGADHALSHDLIPETVIGDMDSISETARAALPDHALHHIAEQDSTDFDKALRNIEAPLILGMGFTGKRQDHQLACFNVLVCRPGRRCILLGGGEIVFLAPPSLKMDLPVGTRLSLFPLGAVSGTSDGLRWPIDGLSFAPDGTIGTSNEVTGPVHLTMNAPKMLIILPAEMLEAVMQAMVETPEGWHVCT